MSTKLYCVVAMPNETDLHANPLQEADYYPTYEKAVDALAKMSEQEVKHPKRETPMRVEGNGITYELWIVNRVESQWYAE